MHKIIEKDHRFIKREILILSALERIFLLLYNAANASEGFQRLAFGYHLLLKHISGFI